MHELAIMQNVMLIIGAEARKSGFSKVISIKLKMGEVSGVVPECLREFFPIASAGTVAEGAKLLTEIIPLTISCADCGYEGAPKGTVCPACGGESYKLLTGREFFVDSIEVE